MIRFLDDDFSPRFKNGVETAALIIAGASVAASAVGTAINAKSVKSTNETQKDLMREQLNWQEGQIDKANEFNTPVNQRDRLEQAGLNPYMMLNGGNAGISETATGTSIPQLQAPQLGNIGSDIAGFGHALQDYRYNEAKIDQVNTDNRLKAIDLRYHNTEKLLQLREQRQKIAGMKLDTDEKRKQLSLLDEQIYEYQMQNGFLGDFLKSRNDRQRNEANVAYQTAEGIRYDNMAKEVASRYAESIEQAKLNQINAAAADAYSSAYEHGQRSKTEIEKRVNMAVERVGLHLSNEEKRTANKYLDEQIRLGMKSMSKHIRQQGSDYWNPFRYVGQVLGGSAAAAISPLTKAKVGVP